MKTLFVLVFAFLLSTAIFASTDNCRNRLTDNLQNNSKTFVVDLDALDITAPVADKMGQAVQIVRSLVEKNECTRSDMSFGQGAEGVSKSRCSFVVPERTASLVCYLETNLGYFFVHWDMGHVANVTFNLWD